MPSPRKKAVIPNPAPSLNIIDLLAAMISSKMALSRQAIKSSEYHLATLAAHQMFDLIDWSRVHLNGSSLGSLQDSVLATLGKSPDCFADLEQLEDYAEKHFVSG